MFQMTLDDGSWLVYETKACAPQNRVVLLIMLLCGNIGILMNLKFNIYMPALLPI